MNTESLFILASRAKQMPGTTPLKSENQIQSILGDIPLLAVGIFAFGACTFLLVLRRINWVIGCLHASVLLAFVGAILEIIEVLGRGNKSYAAVQNVNPFLALIISREIIFSLSFGLRYLFFWGFVACSPLGQGAEEKDKMHSGSWGRWGVMGFLLQWFLALAALAITALQVAFRVYTPLQKISPLYEAEGALESCVSGILMLKIFLNTYLTSLDTFGTVSRARVLLRYLPVLLALLMSLGIAVGNVIQLLFSETILGRFLQGVELYILVLYMLIDTFRPKFSKYSKRRNRSSSFHNMSPSVTRVSEMLLGPPRLSAPKFNPMFAEGMPFPDGKEPAQPSESSQSYAARVGTWFLRRPSKRTATETEPERASLWIQDRAERGESPVAESIDEKAGSDAQELSPAEPKQSPIYRDPVYTVVVRDSVATLPQATAAAAAAAAPPEPLPTVPQRVYSRELDKQYLYPSTPTSAQDTASPIHGLYGVVNGRRAPAPAPGSPLGAVTVDAAGDASARSSGISLLLRQQAELDRSIAALQLFSSAGDASPRASSVGSGGTPHGSARFSLSKFPDPPWGRASVASTAAMGGRDSVVLRPEAALQAAMRQRVSVAASLVPPVERTRQQSVPLSELEAGDSFLAPFRRNPRVNSSGTQYEITSFIGHLTHPGHNAQNPSVSTQGSLLAGSLEKAGAVLKSIPERTVQHQQTLSIVSEKPKISVSIPSRPAVEHPSILSTIEASPAMSTMPSGSVAGPSSAGLRRVIGLPARPSPRSSPVKPARTDSTGSFAPTPF